MPARHIYERDSATYTPTAGTPVPEEIVVRLPTSEDRTLLAELMLAAYSGTIDDDGGIMEDAIAEVENYLNGEYGTPLLEASQLALTSRGEGAAAILISRWGGEELPLITFAMTAPAMQGKGLGRLLLHRSLAALREAGETAVRAVVTEGNTASERLFVGIGFQKIGTA